MTAALVLAAGIIEKDSKANPMYKTKGFSSIRRIINTYNDAGVDCIVCITGHNAEKIELSNSKHGAVFLRNDDYETTDMMSSVKIGLNYLKDKYERILITLVDTPFFSLDTVKLLMESDSPDVGVVVPIHGGKPGHPMLVKESSYDEIINYTGRNGLSFLLSTPTIKKAYIDVSDKGVSFSFKLEYTDDELSEILSSLPPRHMRHNAKITLSFEESFFGPGIYNLLRSVEEFGNVKVACARIGLSYSKARSILKTAEETLGYPITSTSHGGGYGGKTDITERGMELLSRYEKFQREVKEFAAGSFERNFGDAEDLR